MSTIWKLKRQIRSIERSASEDRKKLEQQNAPQEKFQELEASEFNAIEQIENEIDWIVGTRLSREARALDVETPPLSDEEIWRREEYGRRVWYTPKGRAHVRILIHEERTRRFEESSRWFT